MTSWTLTKPNHSVYWLPVNVSARRVSSPNTTVSTLYTSVSSLLPRSPETTHYTSSRLLARDEQEQDVRPARTLYCYVTTRSRSADDCWSNHRVYLIYGPTLRVRQDNAPRTLKVLYPTTWHRQQSEETPGALTIILSQQREAQWQRFKVFHKKYGYSWFLETMNTKCSISFNFDTEVGFLGYQTCSFTIKENQCFVPLFRSSLNWVESGLDFKTSITATSLHLH